MRRAIVWITALIVTAVMWASGGEAYNERTHSDTISPAATTASHLNDVIVRELGLLSGVRTLIRDQKGTPNLDGGPTRIVDWIRIGAFREDFPFCRAARHFHDPLQPWESAGLTSALVGAVCSGNPYASSAVWGQQRIQDIGEQGTWFDARESFHLGLTTADPVLREQHLANAFRSLGHLMHLVEDASVPEHVRNDVHPLGYALNFVGLGGAYGSYENWVLRNTGQLALAGAARFDRNILQQPTGHTEAPISIARLIDTDTYSAATGPGVTRSPAIGIAEFANANFFSEDTGNRRLLGRNYPFPALGSLQTSDRPLTRPDLFRRYFSKGNVDGVANDGGVPVDPVLAECILDAAARQDGLGPLFTYNCVDDAVWEATARILVPKAVDYSAGVLEYFFRGRVEITAPDRFVYGIAPYLDGNAGSFTRLKFKIRNATPNELAGKGTVVAVVRYRTSAVNIIEQPAAFPSLDLSFKVSPPQQITLTSEFQDVTFDFPDPIPANASDVFLTLVYRGPLGLEADAVAIGGKDVSEPTAYDIANVTDYFCFEGQLRNVAALPPTVAARDVNATGPDGIQDLFGPWDEFDVFMKADRPFSFPQASPTRFDASVPTRVFPQYTRYMVIVDQPFYDGSWFIRSVVDRGTTPNHSFINLAFTNTFFANLHTVVPITDDFFLHFFRPNITYRGLITQGINFLVPQPSEDFVPCFAASFGLTPPLVRIDSVIPEP